MRICSSWAHRMDGWREYGFRRGWFVGGRESERVSQPWHSYLQVNKWLKTGTGWRRGPSGPVLGLTSWHFGDIQGSCGPWWCKGVLCSLQPVSSFLQRHLDGEQLLITNIVVSLRWGKLPGEISRRMESGRISVVLWQHCSHADGGSHFHNEWELGFQMGVVQKASWSSARFQE